MRRIISLLSAYRAEQLQKLQAPATKIAEVGEMFSYLDRALDGVHAHQPMDTQLSEVMTSADFTYAIMEFIQRQMLPGYNAKTFNFEAFIKPDTLPNYLPVTRYQNRAGVDDLEYVMEKGEARPGSVDDATKKQWQVYKWQKQYDFSMECLVNDDLGYFADLTDKMGRAARRSLEKYVSRMLWNATSVGRLVGLGALYSTTGRLNTQRVSLARMAFNQRTDARGEPIPAALRFIIYHPGLADTVDTIRSSTYVPELAGGGPGALEGATANNVVRSGWTPIEDPYATGADPNLPWFGLTDWRDTGIIPFVLARRQGFPGPKILRKKSDIESITSLLGGGADVAPIMGDFATSNIVVKVWDEWGTYIDATEGNLVDYRGAFYSSGTVA